MRSMRSPQSLAEMYKEEVRPMLDLVEDLHRLLEGHAPGVSLPRIAVVGNQSSGKSSVLERLSAIELPRAAGLCTRVPLMLSMKRLAQGSESVARISYEGCVQHPGETGGRIVPLSCISTEILQATKALAGGEKGIVDKTITLRVEGPDLPDLTLVDLPGIVYSHVLGQPKDIKSQVRSLILKHIAPEETLILCVFAGDVDLQASEALELARTVDPEGERTLGVVSKLDLVPDKSTLRNKIMQLGNENMGIKLGLAAVRNRTNNELRDGIAAQDCAAEEQQLIKSMELAQVPPQYLGIPALATKLCDLQLNLLKKVLPGIGRKLQMEVQSAEGRLSQLTSCLTPSQSFMEQQRALESLKLALQSMVRGNYEVVERLATGVARLCPVVDELLLNFMGDLAEFAPQVFRPECVSDAKNALRDAAGHALPNFLSHDIFHSLIRKWHAPYAKATRECFKSITLEVKTILIDVSKKVMPMRLQNFFAAKVRAALAKQEHLAGEQIELILKMESRVVYTVNNYYITTLRSMQSIAPPSQDNQASKSSKEQFDQDYLRTIHLLSEGGSTTEARDILKHIEGRKKSHDPEDQKLLELQLSALCYNKVVRKRLADEVMRLIRYFYIEYAADELGLELAQDLAPAQAHKLLRPSVAEAEERARLIAKVDACKRGITRIDDAGEYCVGMYGDVESAEDLGVCAGSGNRPELSLGSVAPMTHVTREEEEVAASAACATDKEADKDVQDQLSLEDIDVESVLRVVQSLAKGCQKRQAIREVNRQLRSEQQRLNDFISKFGDVFKLEVFTIYGDVGAFVLPKQASVILNKRIYVPELAACARIEAHCGKQTYRLRYDDGASYHVSIRVLRNWVIQHPERKALDIAKDSKSGKCVRLKMGYYDDEAKSKSKDDGNGKSLRKVTHYDDGKGKGESKDDLYQDKGMGKGKYNLFPQNSPWLIATSPSLKGGW